MFSKILIANRGEIALRVMQTCRKMGIKTVAVYSEADTNARHVKEADEAIYIGPSPSTESYLNIKAILSAVDQTGAQAVHPGYGFLSENAEFARTLAERNITLIGPSPAAIQAMGDKIESKKLAKRAGVNVVPGGVDEVTTLIDAKKQAAKIGYPVMIKAAAGGGGKGMRIVRDESELKDGMRLASSEARSSFGDARVFIEKFFDNPRHIEIQIIADKHGNVVHLGERECSIQRRHQKVIEEAPSMFVDNALRAKMGKQSVALAKKVDYHTAGTVEFIVDDKKNFYFLEMNTRLQVEHRVTELITGIDIVEQMIRAAYGERLTVTQKDVTFNGWAFESRVYAEDPKRSFLPSIGRVSRYEEPKSEHGQHIIVDSGVYSGGEVSMFYDPMIAKVCTHADSRQAALDVMKEALSSFVIEGVAHNISFLQSILRHERFEKSDISTNFIAQEYPEGYASAILNESLLRVFIGVGVFAYLRDAERAAQTSGQLPGYNRVIGSRWVVHIDKNDYPVIVQKVEGGYDISFGTGVATVRSSWDLGRRLFQGTVNDKPISAIITPIIEGFEIHYGGAEKRVKVRTPRVAELSVYMPEADDEDDRNQLKAPITGLVSSVNVSVGERVYAGQELLVIEAMKMENIFRAEHDAIVTKVNVVAGESVRAESIMVEFASIDEEEAA
jgi:propionyl-CoA carboxylase alpha chain